MSLETNSATADLERIRVLIEDDMVAVDKLIKTRLYSEVVLINQLSHYIIGSGGKRLRPLLALICAKAAGYQGTRHIDIAVIIELIHTATLLHDDVVDSSRMRRGRETANLVWGNEASVLVGDFLYSRAFQMMVDIQNMRVLEILANATNTIAEGEVMQLVNCHDPETTEQRYLDTIRFKTAKLFEAAAQLGVVISGGDPEVEHAMAAYGRHLGTAFQLVDDALDYSASPQELGKNIGDDLAEGKPTLPLLYAMWRGTPEQAGIVREAIEQGGRDRIEEISKAIESTGAITYTFALAEAEAGEAQRALANVPHSPYFEALQALARFAVHRSS
ncbi:MAG: octaprenyl diphosphate synthase [Gammaproteobacteria bacterium]|nr:octaprenyl diphosphate synthase [Gammaproteobacteria bacterium]MBI5615351.1 octaprenyl diphosphate synthase [Gammaproteobacteria bacterium]